MPKLPLIAGGIVVLAVLAVTVYVALQQTGIITQAGASDDPKFITVSNETNDSFTVSWVTTKANQGAVLIPEQGLSFAESEQTKVHTVEVNGLKAATEYKFNVLSGTVTDNNDGESYTALTTRYAFEPDNQLIFGRVFGKESSIPLTEGFATLEADYNGLKTNKIYSLLNEQGGWQLDKSLLLRQDLTQKFDIEQKSLVTITIYSPELIDPVSRSYDLKLSETLQIYDIFLGEDVPWELPAIEDEAVTTEE